ncbi:hypothetical protein ABFB09_06870 [Dehalogenimonas sp. THU2]|uniref:hypothetical protein n=1 Tax=Dehalogenimonas sp. THU2 TaxID=3151121 RepID=UPI003218182F
MNEEKSIESHQDALRCRCIECEVSGVRECNSSRLKALLGSLFADETDVSVLPALFCRRTGVKAQADAEAGCLCAECELKPVEGGFYCRSSEA